MNKILNLPNILTITGQSGAGKDTILELLIEICNYYGIPVAVVHTGKIIAEYCASNKFLSEKINNFNNVGKLTPTFLADALVLNKILQIEDKNSFIVLNGGPRTLEQAEKIYIWSESGILGKIKTLEVLAQNEICIERLIKRTEKDHRTDLSIDGQPGVPSMEKIKTKIAWWSESREAIVRYLICHDLYLSIENAINKKILKENLIKMFHI